MPSPFPGVDIYLEAQKHWEGFHTGFVTYCRDALNQSLPGTYVAELGVHLSLVTLARKEPKLAVPDVLVSEASRGSRSSRRGGGAVATASVEAIKIPLPPIRARVRRAFVQIKRLGDRVPIGVIEVLSPTNKVGMGFQDYLAKREATIRQKVNLVEMDLLLGGKRLPMGRPLPPGDFFAIISRAEERPESNVYAWTIRDPLPTIPIPLSRPDPDVMLDLAVVFATAYENGLYDRLIDYSAPASIVKKPADRAWAERTAKAARR